MRAKVDERVRGSPALWGMEENIIKHLLPLHSLGI